MNKAVWLACGMVLLAAGGLMAQEAISPADVSAEVDSAAPLAAAVSWLQVLDRGEYAQSWDATSDYFRSLVSRESWAAQVGPLRRGMGGLVSRKPKDAPVFSKSLPGAPDGEYVVVAFSATFTNKETAMETVTLMKETDGQWRVAGYFIL
jgi:hypothetical protein